MNEIVPLQQNPDAPLIKPLVADPQNRRRQLELGAQGQLGVSWKTRTQASWTMIMPDIVWPFVVPEIWTM